MPHETGAICHRLKLTAYCDGGAYGDVYVCEDIS